MCALHFSWNFGQIVLWFEIDVTQFDGNEYGDKNGNTYTHIYTYSIPSYSSSYTRHTK